MHKGTTDCSRRCECTCDACQEYYEKVWDAYTKECNLCSGCGMPPVLTLESLNAYKEWHFFQPCQACKPAYVARMCDLRLCVGCQGPLLPYGICRGCDCSGDVEVCECRQCVAKRAEIK
jgi:hypothetical protein